MRIIAGHAKGMRLTAPDGRTTRPTGDRVRESLFSILGDLQGARIADLFAGTGAIGLEALSRGAEFVLLAENDRRVAAILRENLERVQKAIPLPLPETVISTCDAYRIADVHPELTGTFDAIIADPPYRNDAGNHGVADMLTNNTFAAWAGDALLILQHATKPNLTLPANSIWDIVRRKNYGRTTLTFLEVSLDNMPM